MPHVLFGPEVREMLQELKPYLPPNAVVYVLFDRWYAAADLLQFIRRQGWYTICAIKSNRRLNGTRLNVHDQQLRGTRYTRVGVTAAGGATTSYWVREVLGKLKRLGGRARVVISRRHPRDKRPKYFLSTDVTLTAQEHGQRCGSDPADAPGGAKRRGLGLPQALGHLARQARHGRVIQRFGQRQGAAWRSLAEVLADIRAWHARDLLQTACEEVLSTGDVAGVLRRYLEDPPERHAG